jgi:hypothetical protein
MHMLELGGSVDYNDDREQNVVAALNAAVNSEELLLIRRNCC